MKMLSLVPAIVLGVASLALSASTFAGQSADPLTGLANGTGQVLTGIGNAAGSVVVGIVKGTSDVVNGVANGTSDVAKGTNKALSNDQSHKTKHTHKMHQ